MTSIRSLSEILLRDDEITPAQRARFASTIHNESVRLTRLLDEILDLSALEQGERGWTNRVVEAERVLDRAIEVCEALTRQRNMRIEFVARAGESTVFADADRLCQVLINIISNATKYNDASDPVIEIHSHVKDGAYILEISDNGSGMKISTKKIGTPISIREYIRPT